MNTHHYKKIVFITSIVLAFFFIAQRGYASVLSIQTPKTVSVGDRMSVDVFVDPEQVSINSIASSVQFPSEYLEFNGFSAKQSSIPIWVEEPQEGPKGVVSFSGVVPGGLERLYDPLNTSHTAIPIIRLFFISKKAGQATLSLGTSTVLRNDGKGTPTVVTTIPTIVTSTQEKGVVQSVAGTLAQDTTAPHPFTVTLIERSLFGRTPRLAVFSADDPEGGIEHYEVAVGNLSFIRVTSPFVLPYRLFPYILTVRAFDYSGNMQEQQITIPTENLVSVVVPLVAIVSILVGFLAIRFYNRRRS